MGIVVCCEDQSFVLNLYFLRTLKHSKFRQCTLFILVYACFVLALQVCELDIIFNFEKAYFMLDELVLGGEIQETSKKNVLKAISAQDLLQEVCGTYSQTSYHSSVLLLSLCSFN